MSLVSQILQRRIKTADNRHYENEKLLKMYNEKYSSDNKTANKKYKNTVAPW